MTLDLSSLADVQRKKFEEAITLQEVELATGELPNCETPGPDGICAEFYKAFKAFISTALFKVFFFWEAYLMNASPPSFLKIHTVLILKSKEADKLRLVTGYRPSTLCNVNYNFFAKILTRRLQSVITKLVEPHQTCGIKGWSIQTNVHVARSVLEYCARGMEEVARVQIDVQHAFDRVRHDVLFQILAHVILDSVVREGIRMEYANCSTRIIVNGSATSSIPVCSSVRQGCPLSPIIFSLNLKPFYLSVVNCFVVRGMFLESTKVKCLAYAHDIAGVCRDTKNCLKCNSLYQTVL